MDHDYRYDATKDNDHHGVGTLRWRCMNCGHELVLPIHDDPEKKGCQAKARYAFWNTLPGVRKVEAA